MSYQFKFERIMFIKENEKEHLSVQYNESIKQFEQVAMDLYSAMKKKEDLVEAHNGKMMFGLSVREIKQYQLFVENLEKEIEIQQKKVGKARQNMQLAEEKLLEKNLEVKRYEKMKVKDFQNYTKAQKDLEMKQLDEISIRQYIYKGN